MTAETMAQEPIDLERLINQVRGVYAVRLVADQSGHIDEVHVVGTPGRTPKSIVRDIESILYVRGGVRVDHRKISLVQVAEPISRPPASRLQIVDVRHESDEEHATVTVMLRLRDQQVQGVGTTRPGQPADMPVLAAYATLHGLESLFGMHGRMHLERLQRQPLGSLEVYLAHLSRDEDGVPEALLGISVLRDDELVAVVRAVLDAVNRRLERMSLGTAQPASS